MIVNPGFGGSKGGVKMASGSYVGDDGLTRTIECGFRPKLVVVYKIGTDSTGINGYNLFDEDNCNMLIWTGETELHLPRSYPYRTYKATDTSLVISGESLNMNVPASGFTAMNADTVNYKWFAIGE